METFQDRLDELHDAGADLYADSIDSPFSLQEFADQHWLTYPLIGDTEKDLIDTYDARIDFDAMDVEGVARQAVLVVVDADGTVIYARVSDDPGVEPDYCEVVKAAAAT